MANILDNEIESISFSAGYTYQTDGVHKDGAKYPDMLF